MSGRPHVRFRAFHGQFAISQEFVADYKTALFPFRDARFRHQFVAIPGRGDKTHPRLDERNADDTMGFEQLRQSKSRGAKQRRCALIEPAEIVGIEDNFGGITVSELDPDSNAIHKHKSSARRDAASRNSTETLPPSCPSMLFSAVAPSSHSAAGSQLAPIRPTRKCSVPL